MPESRMFARVTMTAAFQRMQRRILRSRSSSPGNHGSAAAGIELTYGLDTVAGKPTWLARARSSSFIRRNCARGRPSDSTTASKESSHSAVS